MIKEELKQEAEESFEQYKVTDEDYVVSPYSDDMGEKMLMYNNEYYAEEMEKQWIANYDFERSDVKY
jgi:hypothetical protein